MVDSIELNLPQNFMAIKLSMLIHLSMDDNKKPMGRKMLIPQFLRNFD